LNPVTFVAADAGASYLIQPTRTAASNISVNVAVAADPRLIAAAAPIRTQATATNTGGAAISAGSVAPGYTAPGATVTLTYSAGKLSGFAVGQQVTVGGAPYTITAAPPTDSIPYTTGATITFSGISFAISGTPDNGDKFAIAPNSGAVSDGRNALALGQLQTQNTMSGRTTNFQSDYAQTVSDIGNKAREVDVKNDAQAALLKQSTDARDSLSGVNLDEEAGNLMRYQQAYQASAKMMDIGNKLFDTLLASMA